MGVFPKLQQTATSFLSLPHARGGVSLLTIAKPAIFKVFPTPVGVFLPLPKRPEQAERLPHARGGVSIILLAFIFTIRSSPRPWGCFLILFPFPLLILVFPTPVGVFLLDVEDGQILQSLPHARGGVSYSQSKVK